ncbi:uncharacterized protein BHQ10_009982 [Talaromyces amestolkiae]|uniref:MACPF domain-containing protein n=1 Tax=Talaromyces amestolkiae TaxID=1196081 RepID=A0A364LDS5_TALAM|nr:uncharacterized protein BHQ10_009982 [Talaromyces amestolkiae]RAO73970.1 hypothetical protein BHQ10_009982 [Talaromyces amestolkiae]
MSVWTATVVAKAYQRKAKLDPFPPAWFWDYKQGLGSHEGFALQGLDLPMALSWLPNDLAYEERELLDYFICTAPSTLAIFEPDKHEIVSLLVRLALSDSSPSSIAVLQSALALSSFHRHGLQAGVFRFRARALRTLITSCTPGIEVPTVVQHIAASMILCHLEMLGMPNTVSLWFCHLSEAKYLIDNAGVDSQYIERQFSGLLGWVEYHMVMSRFTIRHWFVTEDSTKGIKTSVPADQGSCQLQKIKDVSHCSHEILQCLYFMFEMIRQPSDLQYHDDEYESTLRCLERRITNIVPSSPEAVSDTMSTAWEATIELFKLAALIYLKRASRNFSGPSPQIDAMVERAKKLNLGGDVLGFGGEFERTFDETRTGETFKKNMTRYNQEVVYSISFKDEDSTAKYLTDNALTAMKTWTPEKIAASFGTHYTVKATVGGSRILISSLDTRDEFTETEMSTAIELKTVNPHTIGGTATRTATDDKEDLNSWRQSLHTNPALINYKLRPIEELVPADLTVEQGKDAGGKTITVSKRSLVKKAGRAFIDAHAPVDHCTVLAIKVPLKPYYSDAGSGAKHDMSVAYPDVPKGWLRVSQFAQGASRKYAFRGQSYTYAVRANPNLVLLGTHGTCPCPGVVAATHANTIWTGRLTMTLGDSLPPAPTFWRPYYQPYNELG